MAENNSTFLRNGLFSVNPKQELNGTLLLNGPDSVLRLWSNHPINPTMLERQTITGVLDNQKKVSLIDCIKIHEQRIMGKAGISYIYKFFPHYVVTGNRHFSHSDRVISVISFVVDDATNLFHDRHSFGTLMLDPDDLRKLSAIEIFGDVPFVQENLPIIAYYTGKNKIFSADTVIGKVSARHSPGFDLGGSNGAHIRNKIFVDVRFSSPLNVEEMDVNIRTILRFFEAIVGRPQNLLEVEIVEMAARIPESSSVYINMYLPRNNDRENRNPDFRDILIDAVQEPEKFSKLMCAWLERDESWRPARLRFFTGWRKQRIYDPDRIVGAANMFDLLPEEALGEEPTIPEDVAEAVRQSQALFENLQASSKGNDVLGYLGRINKPSLKDKIRHRLSFVTNVIGHDIQEMDLVTNAAVELRHLYVHGDTPNRSRKKLIKFHGFLTDTLEFVFCASDLVELGWDLWSWYRKPKLAGHPFCNFLHSYSENLAKLKQHYGSTSPP